MHPILHIAIQAIRKAGNFIIKQYELFNQNNININNTNYFIHNIQSETDRIIIGIIKKFYPLHIINNKYQNQNLYLNNKNNLDNTVHWIIGPIENNINFIKKFPFLSLSIAVQFKGHVKIGVIYDPIHNELFSACKGRGAHMNGYRIRVSNIKNLQQGTILSVSFPHNKSHLISNFIHKLCIKNVDFRRIGTIGLDLAYVAVGRTDGCCIISIEKDLQLISIGSLIIQESGGLIIDLGGTKMPPVSKKIIAGNPKIIRIISQLFD